MKCSFFQKVYKHYSEKQDRDDSYLKSWKPGGGCISSASPAELDKECMGFNFQKKQMVGSICLEKNHKLWY